MGRNSFALLFLSLVVLASLPANASPVVFAFSGTVDLVWGSGADAALGAGVSGSYSFDSASAGFLLSDYMRYNQAPDSLFSLSVSGGPDFSIPIVFIGIKDVPGDNRYLVDAETLELGSFVLWLMSPVTDDVIASMDLPLHPLPLAQFATHEIWYNAASGGFRTTLASLTETPEPSAFALMGLGVFGLAAVRARKRRLARPPRPRFRSGTDS
ncbi:MAG: PEP-CTERM sorting domain-containing protein [Acidobacteriia bacterium]|nr:PEP-CTERM sorting domain-containing protein [Terriglobia bacterium]